MYRCRLRPHSASEKGDGGGARTRVPFLHDVPGRLDELSPVLSTAEHTERRAERPRLRPARTPQRIVDVDADGLAARGHESEVGGVFNAWSRRSSSEPGDPRLVRPQFLGVARIGVVPDQGLPALVLEVGVEPCWLSGDVQDD